MRNRNYLLSLCWFLQFLLAGCSSFESRTTYYLDPAHDHTSAAMAAEQDKKAKTSPENYPLATSTQGRRCGGIVGDTIATHLPQGSKPREPLQTSKPSITDNLLRGRFFASTFERQMRQASIRHDFCYQHGAATYGKHQQDCDADFLATALQLCPLVNKSGFLWWCNLRARMAYLGIHLFGSSYFTPLTTENNNSDETSVYSDHENAMSMESAEELHFDGIASLACEYENAIGFPRDAVLAGRFRRYGDKRDQSLAFVVAQDDSTLTVSYKDPSRHDLSVRPQETINLSSLKINCPAGLQLKNVGLQSQDILVYPPQVLDVDGDGTDEIVLIGLHLWNRNDISAGGLGLILTVVGDKEPKAFLGTYFPSGANSRAPCGKSFPDSCSLNRDQIERVINMLQSPFVVIPTSEGTGARLVNFSLDKNAEVGLTMHTFTLDRRNEVLSLTANLASGIKDDWRPGEHIQSSGKTCIEVQKRQCEYYRRFQYPPLRFGNKIAGLFRDSCEDIGDPSFTAQPTLQMVLYDDKRALAVYGKNEKSQKPLEKGPYPTPDPDIKVAVVAPISSWPKAAHPMLPMDPDGDALKGVWAIYLSDKISLLKETSPREVMMLRLRMPVEGEESCDASYEITPPLNGSMFTNKYGQVPLQDTLDAYYFLPGFSGVVNREKKNPALVLFAPDKSIWRLLMIVSETDSCSPPSVREYQCATPRNSAQAGMVMVPYFSTASGTSFAVIARSPVGRGFEPVGRIEQDGQDGWSVDGSACQKLPDWSVEQVPVF
jgi:hypothetical protein